MEKRMDGKALAASLRENLKSEVKTFAKKYGKAPKASDANTEKAGVEVQIPAVHQQHQSAAKVGSKTKPEAYSRTGTKVGSGYSSVTPMMFNRKPKFGKSFELKLINDIQDNPNPEPVGYI